MDRGCICEPRQGSYRSSRCAKQNIRDESGHIPRIGYDKTAAKRSRGEPDLLVE